jgi:hypothetical protein
MKRADELRQRAQHYRGLRMQITDRAAVRAICEVAAELENTAEDLERQYQIEERAREIWIERGRPEGYDIDIWLAAEREVDIQRRQ